MFDPVILRSRVCAQTGVFTRVRFLFLTVLRLHSFLGSQDQSAGEALRCRRFRDDPNSDPDMIPARWDHREADPG